MYGVIVTAHGNYPTGIYSALKLVGGEFSNVICCDFLETYTPEDIAGEIKSALEKLRDYEGVFILTDIMGGTPFNQSVMLTANRNDVRVLGGVNFAMLYTAATITGDIEQALETVIQESTNLIGYYNSQNQNMNENEEFDGI